MQLSEPKLARDSGVGQFWCFSPYSFFCARILSNSLGAVSWALAQLEITASTRQEAYKIPFATVPLHPPRKIPQQQVPDPSPILPPNNA